MRRLLAMLRRGRRPAPLSPPGASADAPAVLREDAAAALADLGGRADDAGQVRRLLAFAPPLRPLLVFGDSHAGFWGQGGVVEQGFMPAPVVRPAASARGLGRDGSVLGVGARVAALLAELAADPPRPLAVLFKFGQVDIEFVFNLKRLAAGETGFSAPAYEAFLLESAQRYAGFLARMRRLAPPHWRLVCQDVFPPALGDEALRGGYVNFHIALMHEGRGGEGLLAPLEHPDLAGRTRLHARFNACLDAALAGSGVERLRDFPLYLDESGLLDRRCVAETAGRDQHMDFARPEITPFVAAACARLRALLDAAPAA